MSDYRRNEPEKIDLIRLLKDLIQGFQKFWWLIIALVVLFVGKEYFTISKNYQPEYIASATMSVRCVGNDTEYVNQETAELMAEVFPYILKSGILQKEVANEMRLDEMPGTISMSAEEGTNLFTISASTNEAQLSYDLLQAVLKQYPEVAKFVIGEIEMNILDETGVPKNSGKEEVVRGSLKKGFIEGVMLGCAILALYVLTKSTVKSRKEIKHTINLPDYGSVPYVPAKKRKKGKYSAVNLNNEHVSQIYLESIRKLCIKVMKEVEQKEYRSLLVTSSVPGEGKTTIAVNLAIALARQGKRVVLVDCDPRNPSVAKNMREKEKHFGIGAVLRKEVELKDALSEVFVEKGQLQILYGSRTDMEAAQLLSSGRMGKIIEELEEQADILILDTAPAELLADASALARFVDAALYVVKYDHAKKGQIRNGVQALSMSGIKILGFVFNADRNKRSGGYGYGYKRYGSYYGYGYYGNRKNDDLSGRVIKD